MTHQAISQQIAGCSFCNKAERDVQRLIAGPGVNICDGCVGICLERLEEDRTSDKPANASATVVCGLCSRVYAGSDCLSIVNRGAVCYQCAAAVQDAFEKFHSQSGKTEPTNGAV